ncbi:MAG: glycosyltransferase family 2 protein [Bacteroidota bacterium]
MNHPLSVVIITYQEAKNIHRCISALRLVTDDIIVVDAESSDHTAQIASEAGATVVLNPWEGYGSARNSGAQRAKYDWILAIDADEVIDEHLAESIRRLSPTPGVIYQCNRLTQYCGRWIRHGSWYPEWKSRFYHREFHEWDDRPVHEQLTPQPRTERITGHLLHYAYDSHDQLVSRLERYARLYHNDLTENKMGASLLRAIGSATNMWIRDYIVKSGYRNGLDGLRIANALAKYSYQKWSGKGLPDP